jgi:hypothetical protein
MKKYVLVRLVLVCVAPLCLSASAAGQSAIFNIPSADVTPQGSWGLEANFITKPVSYRDGGFQTYGYRMTHGLTHKTELGANFYLTRDESGTLGQVEFSVKRNLLHSEKHRVSVSAGGVAFVPLRSETDKTAVMVYANARKTVEKLNGLEITGGAYHVSGGGRDFGTRTGAMLAVVQPLSERISFLADWSSGHNQLGYVSAGVNINLTKRQYLTTGYSFGNSGRGNNAFAAYYGVNW